MHIATNENASSCIQKATLCSYCWVMTHQQKRVSVIGTTLPFG